MQEWLGDIFENAGETAFSMAPIEETRETVARVIAGVVARKVAPRVAARRVVLAHRAPLPLGEVGAPALPVASTEAVLFEAPALLIDRGCGARRRHPSG